MLSETLQQELDSYQIGPKLRALRQGRGLTLSELSDHTGLSTAMLSKLETGRLVPTLPTLTRIAFVFSVGLDYFFTDETRKWPISITRKGQRVRFPETMEGERVSYYFESLDFPAVERKLNAYLADFETSANGLDSVSLHEHEGVEFLYVLEGEMGLIAHGEEHVLRAGDAAYFPAHIPHGYRRISDGPSRAVVITVP